MSRSDQLALLAPERSLRHLELKITRRLDGLLRGEHRGLLPGPGSDPAEARLYSPGEDDVRHMDWAVTARTTVPHVRDMIADHELETWALLDLTASMDFGTVELEKRDLAIAALAAIGVLGTRMGDRLGAYALNSGKLRRWPASGGRAPTYAMLQNLLDLPRGDPAAGGPTFADALTGLARNQRKRGLRVIISDFLDDPAGWEPPIRRLAVRNQVIAIEIIDPRELDLPDIGPVVFTDPETGRNQEIAVTARVRADYRDAAAEQRARTRQTLHGCGVAHLVLRTDRDWITDIARFALQQRRVAGRTQPQRGRA